MKYETLLWEIKCEIVTTTALGLGAQCKKKTSFQYKEKTRKKLGKCSTHILKMCNKWTLKYKQQKKGHPTTPQGKEENSNRKMKAPVSKVTRKKGKLARKLVIFGDQNARTECHRQFLCVRKIVDQKGPSEGSSSINILKLSHSQSLSLVLSLTVWMAALSKIKTSDGEEYGT